MKNAITVTIVLEDGNCQTISPINGKDFIKRLENDFAMPPKYMNIEARLEGNKWVRIMVPFNDYGEAIGKIVDYDS